VAYPGPEFDLNQQTGRRCTSFPSKIRRRATTLSFPAGPMTSSLLRHRPSSSPAETILSFPAAATPSSSRDGEPDLPLADDTLLLPRSGWRCPSSGISARGSGVGVRGSSRGTAAQARIDARRPWLQGVCGLILAATSDSWSRAG
jgi:hypothetical protein